MGFKEWLHKNTDLSDSSIDKYVRAVNTTSKDMIRNNVISKSLLEMDYFEITVTIALIMLNADFLAKDKRGNKMYSNALKQYKYYYFTTYDNATISENDLLKILEMIYLCQLQVVSR